ncbi:MAG: RHS repeat-associated core domain-containing protein [Deltaproteobacteria bacterium]|nr:RHS repeat-associated core domain-containing protein [Deltaproteobacteria bacterium]
MPFRLQSLTGDRHYTLNVARRRSHRSGDVRDDPLRPDAAQPVDERRHGPLCVAREDCDWTSDRGSIETVTDNGGKATSSNASRQGEVVEVHGYDPFSLPRSGEWVNGSGRLQGYDESGATTRGFTGQEHLDAHRLIRLNGRVYDPGLGRFLSVDPIIADPANAQSLNAYSYVLNNPLSLIDPSGYVACEVSANPRLSCNYDFLKDGAISSAKDADGSSIEASDIGSGSPPVLWTVPEA